MQVKHLEVVKFIAQGTYSMVYEAKSTRGVDKGKSYALKRFYLTKPKAVNKALSEQRILKRLAMQESQLFFVETLVYSFFKPGKPVLVLNKCSEVNLSDLLRFIFPLRVHQARFYCSEIICGLQQIHALGIVHLDIKPSNMLLSLDGHIQIADFDCAYDMTHKQQPPKPEDFQGAPYYQPPEIANMHSISFAADIWNVGMTMGRMLSRYIRPNTKTRREEIEMIKRGEWSIEGFEQMENPLKFFFQSCFRLDPLDRPSIEEIKQMEFFNDINWNFKALLNRPPPYQIGQFCDLVEKRKYSIDLRDKTLLRTVNWKWKPKLYGVKYCRRDLVIRKSHPAKNDINSLARCGMTSTALVQRFANYEFTNEKVVRTHL